MKKSLNIIVALVTLVSFAIFGATSYVLSAGAADGGAYAGSGPGMFSPSVARSL